MYNILVIEDDNDINSLIKELLLADGYNVSSAFSGTEGKLLFDIAKNDYDLIFLDLMLPGMSGEDLLRYIRDVSEVPVIIVSAKSIQNHKVNILKLGADDYITKPFDINELSIRAMNILKRVGISKQVETNKNLEYKDLEYKDLILNLESFEVSICNNITEFTHREFLLLKLFIENSKKVFTKANLYESIWEEEYLGDDNTLNVHISNIRKKILKNGGSEVIDTVWGIGYKLKV